MPHEVRGVVAVAKGKPRDFPMLIDLYLRGKLDLDGFVSETIRLDQVEAAFEKKERGEVLRSVVVL
jgi:S-(hydroxymethyl)mycothiol dehydrogenase